MSATTSSRLAAPSAKNLGRTRIPSEHGPSQDSANSIIKNSFPSFTYKVDPPTGLGLIEGGGVGRESGPDSIRMGRISAEATLVVAMLAIARIPIARGFSPSTALVASHVTLPGRDHRGHAVQLTCMKGDPATLQTLRKERIFSFDTGRFPIREAVMRVLKLDASQDLSAVHEISGWHTDKSGNRVNALQTMWNADRDRSGRSLGVCPDRDRDEALAAYAAFDQVYQDFVREVVAPSMGGGKVLFQRAPTLRVMVPDAGDGVVSVMARLHKDEDYHHQPSELNFWLPLTPVFGGNTLWVESEPGKGDFHPLELDYGRYVRSASGAAPRPLPRPALCASRLGVDSRRTRSRSRRAHAARGRGRGRAGSTGTSAGTSHTPTTPGGRAYHSTSVRCHARRAGTTRASAAACGAAPRRSSRTCLTRAGSTLPSRPARRPRPPPRDDPACPRARRPRPLPRPVSRRHPPGRERAAG